MSLVGIHALPLKVVYMCGIVVIKDHSPYSSRQLPREISRCGVRHRDIYLTFIIHHRTFQLSATFKHILRLLTSPRIGVEYCLQTRATIEHSNHIRHRRGVEIREIQKRQTRATKEHPFHIRHRRGVELRDVEFFSKNVYMQSHYIDNMSKFVEGKQWCLPFWFHIYLCLVVCCLGCLQQGEVSSITLLFHLGLWDETQGSTVDAIAQTALFLGTIVEDVT